jgi:hypothetical protein
MQRSDYLLQAREVFEQYEQYKRDLTYIFDFSECLSKDIVKYVLKVLDQQNNPEIGRVLIEVAFEKHVPMLSLLKTIVKTLYVVGHIGKHKHGNYPALKKNIDETLTKIGGSKAFIAKKKYELLLAAVQKDEPKPKNKEETKAKNVEAVIDTINKQYINFV